MLGEFDFHLLQVQHLKAAMDELPTYRPLNMTPAKMQTEYDNGISVRSDFELKDSLLNMKRGVYHTKMEAAHKAVIRVYAILKTRYQNDPATLEAITKLPTHDQSPEDTRVRCELTSGLWEQLPDDPYTDPPGPFIAWPGMDRAAFDAIMAAMKTAQAAFVSAFQRHEKAQGVLHVKDAQLSALAVAALSEGRAQFQDGTPEREMINSIPTMPSTQPPNQAVISIATSPDDGEAHLEFDAAHATSFSVLHKGPGETNFTTVAADILDNVYDATNLADGAHAYKVIGQNSRGSGPESAVATVTISSAPPPSPPPPPPLPPPPLPLPPSPPPSPPPGP